jgi:hypothetical protein
VIWSVTCLRYYTLIAHCQYLLTGGRFLPFIRISVLRTPHATCIFMSRRASLVKSCPLQFRALHYSSILKGHLGCDGIKDREVGVDDCVFCMTFPTSLLYEPESSYKASLDFPWGIILSKMSVCYWYFTLGAFGVLMCLGVCYCAVYLADGGEQVQGRWQMSAPFLTELVQSQV